MLDIVFYILIAFGIILLPKYIKFRSSDYQVASNNSFFKTVFNRGNYGEFLTFNYLEKLDGYHKLMTNLYIPKEDGTTTEIDLVMISETGIYVFESKNYSGWIFGNEKHKNWTQSLQNKQKYQFLNPIWQNKGHINALKTVLDQTDDSYYKSYIIFSERCELKKITITSPSVKVIKRNSLIRTIKEDIRNSPIIVPMEKINEIYLKLQKYTRVDERVKEEHVRRIRGNM